MSTNLLNNLLIIFKSLRLTWNALPADAQPSGEAGWNIEIFGRNNSIDMSPHNFIRVGSAPYRERKDAKGRSTGTLIGMGPPSWVLTPDEEPLLGIKSGAKQCKPPMAFVTQYLEFLEEKGYHVVASHSKIWGDGSYQHALDTWTLSK